MAVEMSDNEFLGYLDGMLTTPDCGVVPQQVARLLRLADPVKYAELAVQWDAAPLQVLRRAHADISKLVAEARARLAAA